MKFNVFIVAVLVGSAMASCSWFSNGRGPSGRAADESRVEAASDLAAIGAAAEEETTSEIDRAVDSLMKTYVSHIRPGEVLKAGEVYTDDFTYIDYNTDTDYYHFVVCLPDTDENIHLYDGMEHHPELFRGDKMRVEWHIGPAWEAGDGDALYLAEWVNKVTKTADGSVAKFRAAYPKGLQYGHSGGWDPTEEDAEKSRTAYYDDRYYYGAAECFIATSDRPEIEAWLADPSADIQYWACHEECDGRDFEYFEIWNENEVGELSETVISFWLSDDYPRGIIYERDPESGEFKKLLTY